MAPASDRIPLPPLRREFSSPAGRHQLVVESADGWKTPQPVVTLSRLEAGHPPLPRWTQTLPHHYGPRAVLVTDSGQTLLVDEWINVRSRQTLMLIDVGGRIVLRAGSEQVLAALGASEKEIASHARLGPWLSEAPLLAADQQTARIAAGGRVLVVDLTSGTLTGAAR